jgi:hypothetical protein
VQRVFIGNKAEEIIPYQRSQETRPMLQQVLLDYLITFGWAIVGSVAMGLGIIIALKMFDLSTRKVDEWELIKQGNIPVAIILAAVVISLGIVIAAAINPMTRGQVVPEDVPASFVPETTETDNVFGN